MHRTPNLLLFVFVLALTVALYGCDNATQTEIPPTDPPTVANNYGPLPTELYIYTPKNLFNQDLFVEYADNIGVDVVLQYYTSEAELLEKFVNGPGKITLVVASNYAASVFKEKNQLTALDPGNIPNLLYIDGRFRNPAYDPYNQYCAAFTYGTIGIGYVNGQGVTPPTSWNDLFHITPDSPAYGRITLLNHPHEALGAALLALGYDPNTTNESEIQAAKELILDAAPSFASFENDEYWKDLANNQTALVQGYSREMLRAYSMNTEVQYVFPSEGALLRPYNLCILQGVTPDRKLAGELFINSVLTPEWATSNVQLLKIPSTLMLNEAQISPTILEDPLIFPTTEKLNQSFYVYAVGPQENLYTIAWNEILEAIP